jgi:hypothetical protein
MNTWNDPAVLAAADVHHYILALPNGRGPYSYYENSAALGPGEQDILDVVPHADSLHLVDPDRVYLGGFSMGGYGTWHLGLRNPDLWAAIAPGAGWTDTIEHWEKGEHNLPPPNLATALGGPPGTSSAVDARWLGASARMILDNAMNLPIHVFHGDTDTSIPNNLAYWPYMHSHHLTDTPGYADERGTAVTLQELAAAHPGRYFFETTFVPGVGHNRRLVMNPELVFTFFDAHARDANPLAVAFRTYDDAHTQDHWLRLLIEAPNTTASGLARASRDPGANSFELEIEGQSAVELDLSAMELATTAALAFDVAPLPAYAGTRQNGLALLGDWSAWFPGGYVLRRDGVRLAEGADFTVAAGRLDLLPFDLTAAHAFAIAPESSGLGEATPGAAPTAALRLLGAFPNPAAGAVEVRGIAPGAGLLRLTVVDGLGRVRRGMAVPHAGGAFAAAWDGRGAAGRALAAGRYWLVVESGGERAAAPLVRLR